MQAIGYSFPEGVPGMRQGMRMGLIRASVIAEKLQRRATPFSIQQDKTVTRRGQLPCRPVQPNGTRHRTRP